MPRKVVLFVDDDPDVLVYYAIVLRSAGYEVATARDGEEAIRRARELRPALVVADVFMPGTNGFQMCRKLKQGSDTRQIPVLLVSRKADEADQFWAQETGAAKLLPKPIDSKTLLAEITALL